MSNLFGNSQIYNIHAENEVAEVLSNFETEFCRQVVADKLAQKFTFPTTQESPNMIGSLEQNFKHIVDTYTEQQGQIYDVRTKTYLEIIEIIKNHYNLDMNPTFESRTGNYTEVYWMYDFFIGNFLRDLVKFFSIVIMHESAALFDALPAELRSVSAYSEKTYTDNPKLGVVVDNLAIAINNICCYDFSMYDIISTVYNREIADIICSAVVDKGDFFKNHYVSVHQSFFGARIFTDIQLYIYAEYVSSHGGKPIIE